MPSNSAPDDFREQLSAWHDGALSAEASLFVLKRLLHDDALRAGVGRWQAIGDALRQQPLAAVGARMPERVSAAIIAESTEPSRVRVVARSGRLAPGLGWWATAAVVGVAAVLLLPGQIATEQASSPDEPVLAMVSPSQDVPTRPLIRNAALPPLQVPQPNIDAAALVVFVPPLVRAPQPSAEQLAPLPAIEAPSRPWPRSGGMPQAFRVQYLPSDDSTPPHP